MEQVITISLGELVVTDNPDFVLVAFGLGSCVGITAYDRIRKVGGLLHAMLPQRRNGDNNLTKFVDTGLVELLNRMVALGAKREQMIWRFAGGAQMLTAPGMSDRFNIGQQNVTMTQEMITRHRLNLTACETGGYQGRTLRLLPTTGEVTVRYIDGKTKPL